MEMSKLFLWSGTRIALSITVVGASALAAGTADAWSSLPTFNAPGIPQASLPAFTNQNQNALNLEFGLIGGSVKSIDGYTAPAGDYVLAATTSNDGAFYTTINSFKTVESETFSMDAVFNSKGQFISGGETIYGCSPPGTSCSKSQITNLYSVSFNKFGVSTSTVGLGFETNYSTASGWAKQFQHQNESLYLYAAGMASLDNALASGKNIPKSFSLSGVNGLAAVPLPAAAWLFGPALFGMFGVMGRRSRSQAAISA